MKHYRLYIFYRCGYGFFFKTKTYDCRGIEIIFYLVILKIIHYTYHFFYTYSDLGGF